MRLTFELVDVFAEEKYAGNQLAVVTGASDLTDVEMQKIANEMHFSETSFVLSDKQRDGGYDVRIFTPVMELPFAGHPTLGTAYVIRKRVGDRSIRQIILNLKAGKILVTFERDDLNRETVWMKQNPPVFGKEFDAQTISRMLNLGVEDVDNRFPIQEVSTGISFIIVPLRTLDAVRRARVNKDLQLEMTKETRPEVLIFCPQTYEKENALNVRVFVDLFGIPEDPATGSGNGCLAGYLSHYRYFDDENVNVRVEQGYEINRRSILRLRAHRGDQEIEVKVGGRVIPIATGSFH
jgi:trans-2,3-dihydro-3-hydroxyanthranilate isomerase